MVSIFNCGKIEEYVEGNGGIVLIGKKTEALLMENQDAFIIPAENVATVLYSNPLEHALLVLSKVGYSKIPVLDAQDHLVGLISLANIVNKMIELTGLDLKLMEDLTVADVMEVSVPTISDPNDLEEILHLLVDASFLPLVDGTGIFQGIITRKEILKSVNHLVHEVEKRYVFVPKEEEIEAKKVKVELKL